MTDVLYLFVFLFILSGLVAAADIIRRRLHWSSESTRKFVHIITGIVVVFTPFVLNSMWPMVALGTLFAVMDYLGVRKNWFHGMHGTSRSSLGTVYYPISFVILVFLFWNKGQLVLIISMLIMAIADALAAMVGERYGKHFYMNMGLEKKSIPGSLAMLLSSLLIILGGLVLGKSMLPSELTVLEIVLITMIVGFVATACEMLSLNGSDNFTVPLGSAFVLHYLLLYPASTPVFAIGMGMSLLIALVSWRARFLTPSGSVGAFLLGTLVFGMGSWAFTVPMLTFFILSSLVSKAGKRKKAALVNVFEKSGERDIWQVLANGGIPGLLVMLWGFSPLGLWYNMYIAALAAVMADTWGTEIGVLARQKPISVLTLKPVPMGTSGGITLMGTLGGMLGAAILIASTVWSQGRNASLQITGSGFLILLLAAVFASFVDSLLGATVQVRYKCGSCGKITEKKIHCGVPAKQDRGYRWINNDLVNVLCAVSGALVVFLFGLFS